MRSPDRILRPLGRALFPRIDPSRLRVRGGWVTFPIFLLITALYPISLDQADWVDTRKHFVWIAVAAVALGTLVGNGRLRARGAGLLGGLGGTLAVVLATILATNGGTLHARATAIGVAVNNWMTQVKAGEAASDPTVFVLFLGATVWSSAYVGAFILARERRPWDALVLCGGCLVINVSLALSSLLFDLVLFSLAALVFLTRLHIVALQERWERRNIAPAGEMDWRLLRGGLTWTTVLVVMALLTPRVSAADAFSSAFTTFDGPYRRVEAEWQRFFAGVSGPSRIQGVSFSDAIRLGQAPNLGDRVIMTVDAGSGRFWRAVTYDFYTGAGWRITETDRQDGVNVTALAREKFDATFNIVVPHANLLFGANEPTKASVPSQFLTGEDRSYSTSLRALDRVSSGSSYTVSSLVSKASKDELRAAGGAYPASIRAKYLQLPSSLPQRVRDKAREVAGAKPTAYDKAEAIETFLRSPPYKYSTTVKNAPPGRDPVDFFLFDLKEDFCEYFASSMAVLLREVGVPSRVVEGFTGGEFDPALGRFVVRELNAHAWVEAYFPQYGWIEFEPTPSQGRFARTESPAAAAGSPSGANGPNAPIERPDREGLRVNESEPGGGVLDQPPSGLAAAVRAVDPRPALAVGGLILLVLLGLLARFQWRFRGLGAIEAAWGKTRLLGAYAGHAPRSSDTPYEYAASLGAAVPGVSAPLRTIAHARVRERYAANGASSAERAAATSAWRQVARALLRVAPSRVVRSIARLVR